MIAQRQIGHTTWKSVIGTGLLCVFVFAMGFVAMAHHVTAHDAPPPLCAHLDIDDQGEMLLAPMTHVPCSPPQPHIIITCVMITMLHLAPVIFQPPETA